MGGPSKGDCAGRGPGNDRYTWFPFHPSPSPHHELKDNVDPKASDWLYKFILVNHVFLSVL